MMMATSFQTAGICGGSESISYYLSSSVLEGAVITEIAATGEKRRTFVHAGGGVLAWQMMYGSNQAVQWEHRDESSASLRMTDSQGNLLPESAPQAPATTAELDPAGADAGLSVPVVLNPPPEERDGALTGYPSAGIPSQLRTTYSLDGMPVTTDFAMQAMSAGWAAQCPNNDCGPRWDGSMFVFFHAFADGTTSWGALSPFARRPPTMKFLSSAQQQERKRNRSRNKTQGQRVGRDEKSSGGWEKESVTRPNWSLIGGFRMGFHANFDDPKIGILAESFSRITKPDCEEWINKILAQYGAPEDRNTLEKLLRIAQINRYSSDLTADDMGISQRGRDSMTVNIEGGNALATTITEDNPRFRIYLGDNMFLRTGAQLGGVNIDTAGHIVHELFHIAGFNHPAGQGFDFESQIHDHCGLEGTNY
jgi:hypothetical protein